MSDIGEDRSKSLALVEDDRTKVAIFKRNLKDDGEFKKPNPSKRKKVVLDEDKYASDLDKIIQREFFPDLEKLKAQNAYLQAVENNDFHMLRELYSKFGFGKNTPRGVVETPLTFETPTDPGERMSSSRNLGLETPDFTPTHLPMESPRKFDPTEIKEKNPKEREISLNEYLDKYTSEDNQSFQDISDEAERKHRNKFSWLYESEKSHNERQRKSLGLPSIEEQAAEYKRPLDIDTWNYKNKNYIMFVPDGVPFTAEEEVEMAKKKQEVVLENTRFATNPFKDPIAPEKPIPNTKVLENKYNGKKDSEGKFGFDGKEVEKTETPKVNGFSFVRTPDINPGVEDSPFMTWGEIEGTPFRLDAGDTPIPSNPIKPFRILEESKREKLAIELADKVSQRYRDKKQKAMDQARTSLGTPSPRPGTMDRLSSISPAARNFALKRLQSGDLSLRSSYTPKRSATPLASPFVATPKSTFRAYSTPSTTPTATATSSSNLTDNLLRLPKRKESNLVKGPKMPPF